AALLGIGSLLDRYPATLSGGEAQRIALGRALACRPPILCLDEPLSALDDETRTEMYSLLKRVQAHTHVTTLHITHNRSEADHLGDLLLRMEAGTGIQVIQPEPISSQS
ncbi:MAG: ATP-binding cassette domain-containing protein, partial [bacterium]|nr:ATP-binding cassette domain-containing protein [bacterium]